MRIRLDIAYAGAGFHGWAAQPGQRTVQGELETALAAVLREPVALTVAGRTDAGVHARGQVAHCDVSERAWAALPARSDREPSVALVRGVNAVLARRHSYWERWEDGEDALLGTSERGASSMRPASSVRSLASSDPVGAPTSPGLKAPASSTSHAVRVSSPRGYSDVVVRMATAVPDVFDARFSALWRRYSYRIADSVLAWNPLVRDVLWLNQKLDVEAMNRSGEVLLGEHDFLSFCKPRPHASTVRTLHELHCERRDDGVIEVRVRADAFCHSQVRSLMGALIEVGRGARAESWPAQLLRVPSRSQAAPVAPAHPLTLEEIGYPPPDDYAAQAARARIYRGTDELAEARGHDR
ncbi:MAG: tRNA pseudouridine synthase A [Actinomycetaceae bacterium]|nr:tRNA pseudouridine synthase A [Actinomycetaceae bacterium]